MMKTRKPRRRRVQPKTNINKSQVQTLKVVIGNTKPKTQTRKRPVQKDQKMEQYLSQVLPRLELASRINTVSPSATNLAYALQAERDRNGILRSVAEQRFSDARVADITRNIDRVSQEVNALRMHLDTKPPSRGSPMKEETEFADIVKSGKDFEQELGNSQGLGLFAKRTTDPSKAEPSTPPPLSPRTQAVMADEAIRAEIIKNKEYLPKMIGTRYATKTEVKKKGFPPRVPLDDDVLLKRIESWQSRKLREVYEDLLKSMQAQGGGGAGDF